MRHICKKNDIRWLKMNEWAQIYKKGANKQAKKNVCTLNTKIE